MKPTAYPELIDPGDWAIEPWTPDGSGTPCPCTDVAGHRMYVPAGRSPFARDVRFHEMLHVKYSPPEGAPSDLGISLHSLLAAEDCRVNLLGSLIRPHDAAGHSPRTDPFMLAMSQSERGMAQLTAASIGYASTDRICDEYVAGFAGVLANTAFPIWLRRHARVLRDAVHRVRYEAPDYFKEYGEIDKDVATFDATIALARWLDSEFSEETAKAPSKGTGEEGDGEYNEKPGGNGCAEDAMWGEMRIETPPLTDGHRTPQGRRTTPSLGGTRIRHMNRMVTGEIFGRPRKAAVPDAVLVDMSGSMHWNVDKLHELVEKMPVGIVAGYAGGDGKGVLRVLAKDGRMVPSNGVALGYGGNEVDGPALRWLAKQHGRKVWVSDQGVCSDRCDDESALMADCERTMKRAGIRVCLTTSPDAIMRTLRGLPVRPQEEEDDQEECEEEETDDQEDDGDQEEEEDEPEV
jgi:hypothetical protein